MTRLLGIDRKPGKRKEQLGVSRIAAMDHHRVGCA